MRTRPARSAHAVTIDQAIDASPALSSLAGRLRDSHARFLVIHPLLPESLAAHVKPGPVDDEGWSLIAANAAVASKLRQLRPRLEDALRDSGWQSSLIRVKVAGASGNRM